MYRAYNPTLGRWISRDPIGELSPDGPNLYGYVRNDPARLRDPRGLVTGFDDALELDVGIGLLIGEALVNTAIGIEVTNLIGDAIAGAHENQPGNPERKSCPLNTGGLTNPNTPDPDDPGGNLKKVSNAKLRQDRIDAELFKDDIVQGRGARFNISVDSAGNVYLTPVRPGEAPNMNTQYTYDQLKLSYPLPSE